MPSGVHAILLQSYLNRGSAHEVAPPRRQGARFYSCRHQGEISPYKWDGDSWAFFFSHSCEFMLVRTNDKDKRARLATDFAASDTTRLRPSVDTVSEHLVRALVYKSRTAPVSR